jgi:hypothetical protein
MKRILFTFILFLSILFSCSKDDNKDSVKSYLEINGTQYELNQGAISYYGNFEGLGVYLRSILLLSPEISVDWDNEKISGIGPLISLDVFNTQESLIDGTYSFSTSEVSETEKVCDGVDRNADGQVNDSDCYKKLPAGKSYIASNLSLYGNKVDTQSDEEPETTFKSGTVTLQKDGDNYTITFDCIGKNNDIIKGIYQGTLKSLDYSED